MSNTLSLIILLIVFFIIITFVKKIIFNIMSKGKYKNIKLNEAIELYKNNKNIGLIDVRSYQEVRYSGYIKNSINIALDDSNFNEKMSKLDKDKEYIVYCASGYRFLWLVCVCINWVLKIYIILRMLDIQHSVML